jgi:hypothetical protein
MKLLSIVPRALRAVAFAALVLPVAAASAQQPREDLREPVFRVSKTEPVRNDTHPLDPALRVAYDGLAHIHRDIRDYTCTMVKRERINGELAEQEFMYVKFRSRKTVDGRVTTPMAVYMKFLKPALF